MKNIVLPILLYAMSNTILVSQSYQRIEWDVLSISRLMPSSNNTSSAIGISTEARFNMNNRLSIGLNYNWQFFDQLFDEPVRGLGVANSVGLTGDYYFKNKLNNRAFVGVAIGSFNNEATTELGVDVGSKGLGIAPRMGYEMNFIRLTVEYNQTFKEDFPNYFALGFGLNIGGRYN